MVTHDLDELGMSSLGRTIAQKTRAKIGSIMEGKDFTEHGRFQVDEIYEQALKVSAGSITLMS